MKLRIRAKNFIIILFISLSLFYCIKYISYSLINSQRPNIIIITLDALRPDHLGCYGYKRDTSPNIDGLSKFNQAITQGSWTVPSFVSFITSIYPGVLRCNNRGIYTLKDILLCPKLSYHLIPGLKYPHKYNNKSLCM